jgi:hypothetical protein
MQSNEERIRKSFWVTDSQGIQVTEETCLSCRSPNDWYCPKYGFTGTVGHSLFEDRASAVRALQVITQRLLHNAQENHEKAMKL